MKNKGWTRFGRLVDTCFDQMFTGEGDISCWLKAFHILVGIVEEERARNKKYAREFYFLDELTEYLYDVQGWMEDYIDVLVEAEAFDVLLESVEWLLSNFDWKKDSDADIKFQKAFALTVLGRRDEAEKFCKEWLRSEPETMQAIVASINVLLSANKIKEAEQLVEQYITEDTECTEENDMVFLAAETLYEIIGNQQAAEHVRRELERYEGYLEACAYSEDEAFVGENEDNDYLWNKDELPFGKPEEQEVPSAVISLNEQGKRKMVLPPEDAQLYYKLWLPLLDYVGDVYNFDKKVPSLALASSIDFESVKKIADRLWDDVSIIDKYLSEPTVSLSEEERQIILSWKRCKKGQYFLERHLKKGSIFISAEDEQVYQVSGIISSWEEMLGYLSTPILLEATFIPFKETIISDGLVIPYNMMLGSNITKHLKEIYMSAKKSGNLHKTL